MGRQPRTRKRRRANQSSPLSSIIPIVILFIMGIKVAVDINLLQDDVSSTLVFLVFLIAINIGLFRYMGLHRALQRTHRIKYWTIKQKSLFSLYLLLIVLMIGEILPHGEILTLLFLLGLLYIGIRSVMHSYKNLNAVLPSLPFEKRSKFYHMDIKEIDKMEGTAFEVFLSELYDGMGYYTEVTPNNDFGIDVIIIKDKIKAGIQAKCYGEGRTVGVEAVNEVCGGAGYWKVQKKMVITNRFFTKKALITAKSNNVEMIDRDGLQFLIKEYQKISEQRKIFNFFSFLNKWKNS